ncbi:FKBP-type 22 kDa peptidyl-prolyl cis-trans isomerase [Vibrio aerogenes CECT 7868]|uniref:Peptidyl-prolyl cis-trans isomerase n=1 Tax=Vibrio aerogenes CECT 7868 TaxID=1216006 RepID=A0A1M5ZKP4_9VIBR|nr:FKBP-type peptidyl-prolyl cis-trans isomerase [Vibrio aerogenes]SHI24732.1 FKBP-type 22 kDa peptidyl-prolyl cis-trans isomerase [Vibrio aerogenes CECT 7868]
MENNYIFAVLLFIFAGILFYTNHRRHKIAKEHIEEGSEFLEKNAKEEGVITTKSGLQYLILEEGTGENHPTLSNKVKVHYEGKLINGEVFNSSYTRNQPIDFGVKQVISGWQEGLQLMVVGQKARFYIPYKLAYGLRKVGKIPPGSCLIFEIKLLEIH